MSLQNNQSEMCTSITNLEGCVDDIKIQFDNMTCRVDDLQEEISSCCNELNGTLNAYYLEMG